MTRLLTERSLTQETVPLLENRIQQQMSIFSRGKLHLELPFAGFLCKGIPIFRCRLCHQLQHCFNIQEVFFQIA
ncbi:hypothetical protein D3C74_492410 [compost metagenome]